MSKIPEPMNVHEQYLYAMTVRLDALCNMLSSLIEVISEEKKIPVTSNKEEKVDTQCKGKTRKGTRCQRTAEDGSEFCNTHKEG